MNDLITEISMGPFGSDIKVEYFVSRGVPVLNGSNVSGFKVTDDFQNFVTEERANGYRKAIAIRGDIVITHRGTLGQIAYVPDDSQYEKYVISQSQFKVRLDNKEVNPVYFTYYFHTKEGQQRLLSFKSHVGVPALAQATTNFRLLDFPLIPKPKQDAIASVLETLDKKIELNNQINTELEAMAKTLYDYWFVQFDFPDADGKPYKSSGGKMVYNEVLKREIPEGWKDCELGEHIEFQRGISYKSTDIKDDGVPFINLNSFLLTGQFKLSGTKYFNGNFKQESKLNVGDLVIAITDVTRNADITGKAFVIPDVFKEEPLISCDVAAVSSETFTVGYLEQLFNSDSYHAYIKNYATGTLVLHLNLDGVNWFKTTLPPMTLLNRYEDYCKSLFKQRNITLKENIQLEKLRDWLLPMLMNGQVKVK